MVYSGVPYPVHLPEGRLVVFQQLYRLILMKMSENQIILLQFHTNMLTFPLWCFITLLYETVSLIEVTRMQPISQ
jgi:hypothetical protein